MDAWAQQFEAQMADMQHKLEERLANIPFVDNEQVARRAQEAAERARRQAERAAERARARAERARAHAEREGHKHGHHGVGFRVSWPSSPQAPQPPRPSKPPAEPVTDAERTAILKMVADKKITADEASRLLSALEGEV
jgi:Xaa-Pro aminopeptidase